MRYEWPLPDRTCLIRSFPFPAAGSGRSRPGLRLRYFRVGGSLPMRYHAFLPGTVMNGVGLDPALPRDAARGGQPLQAIHRRTHHIVRVRRATTLREDVADPGALQHRAHRPTGDHARSRRGRLEQHPAGAVLADDLVRNRAARERHFRHAAARRFDRLAHRFADLVRLAGRDAHVALAVPDRDERVEAEAPAALHDFGDAIDRDDVFDHAVAVAPAPVAAVAPLATAASAAAAAATGATLAAGAAWRPVLHCRRRFGYRRNVRHRNAGRSRCLFLLIVH